MTNLLEKQFNEHFGRLVELLSHVDFFAVTTDSWSSNNGKTSFLK
jgi:hypothetical protein